MANPYFQFKQFTVYHDRCAMKVTTDGCLFGAWCADEISKQEGKARAALDIGAGTGLLSLMVAQKNLIDIEAIEIEPEAAVQAAENASLSPWKERIKVKQGDVLHYFYNEPFDVIFSNPPFYEHDLLSGNKAKNTAHHHQGLLLSQLLQFIAAQLSASGYFYLLFPFKRLDQLREEVKKAGLGINQLVIVKQSTRHSGFRIMVQGRKGVQEPYRQKELCIRNEQEQYTPEFTALLKAYYLYL